MTFESEVQMGAAVVRFYRANAFETFGEVEAPAYSKRADLVAIRPTRQEIHVVEMKLAFGLEVIAQAEEWLGWCHQSWVAVPKAANTPAQDLGRRTCERLGVGIIRVTPAGGIEIELPARLFEDPHDLGLRDVLTEEHRNRLPGSSTRTTDRPPTKFDALLERVAAYVRDQPRPVPPAKAVENIGHHFRRDAIATRAILDAAKAGRIPGVEFYFNGRRNMLRAVEMS